MSNAIIGFGNLIDSATLSGGGWTSGLPITNLQVRQLGEVARTSSLLTTATQFDAAWPKPVLVKTIALVAHSLYVDAQYRIRAGSDPTFATYDLDTGWNDVWQRVYPFGTIDWGADNWWSLKYNPSEILGYTRTLTHILDAKVRAQYWRVELSDPTNPDGYVQIGRPFFGDGWQPSINMLAGAGIGWETTTKIQTTLSGGEYPKRRTPFRVARFTTRHTDDEGLSKAFEIQRQMGVDGEVLFIFNPADTVHAVRRRFYGRLRTLSQLEYPWVDRTQTAWEIKESTP